HPARRRRHVGALFPSRAPGRGFRLRRRVPRLAVRTAVVARELRSQPAGGTGGRCRPALLRGEGSARPAQHPQPADGLTVGMTAMADELLSYLWETAVHRFLAEGINYRDLLDLRERIATIGEWPARWSEMAAHYEQLGDGALASGFTATAGSHLA